MIAECSILSTRMAETLSHEENDWVKQMVKVSAKWSSKAGLSDSSALAMQWLNKVRAGVGQSPTTPPRAAAAALCDMEREPEADHADAVPLADGEHPAQETVQHEDEDESVPPQPGAAEAEAPVTNG